MSSKRGRKRNDNLPPNRARDVQRAFRARRAAHLRALEDRVSELEEENNYLRQALNLPPSNRPPLGRGPTGKDKPKAVLSNPASLPITREASVILDSTPSPASSDSPVVVPVSMSPSRPMTVVDSTVWDGGLLPNHNTSSAPITATTSNSDYPVTSVASISTAAKQVEYSGYGDGTASSGSRNSSRSYPDYHDNYSGTSNRTFSTGYAIAAFPVPSENPHVEGQEPRTQYPSYLPTSYPSHQTGDSAQVRQSPSPLQYSEQQPQHRAQDLTHPQPERPNHVSSLHPHPPPVQIQPGRHDIHPSPRYRHASPSPFTPSTPDPRSFPVGENYHLTGHTTIGSNSRGHNYALQLQGIPRHMSPYGQDIPIQHPM